MLYQASYVMNGIACALLVEAEGKDEAERAFLSDRDSRRAEISAYVISEARADDMKPGKPIIKAV